MKPNSTGATTWERQRAEDPSLTDRKRVAGWSDDEVEAMASADQDHPPLDDAFWRDVDRSNPPGRSRSANRGSGSIAERSHELFTRDDLRRITNIALDTLDEIAVRLAMRPAGLNRPNLRVIALAQGAALHFVDDLNGIKDFDLWAFFAEGESPCFPARSIWNADFGPSKFGVHPDDASVGYLGRRIDIIGRSIAFAGSEGERSSIQAWLRSGSRSADHLTQRPLVALYPEHLFGQVIWTPQPRAVEGS